MTAVAAIRPVIGISWPRSGHHLAVRLLTRYFGPGFGYCEYHKGAPPSAPDIASCCGKVPCAHLGRGVHFTKNHDFDLSAPQVDDHPYFVQYRDFVPSVVSNFELAVRAGAEDSAESFRRFASNQFSRYRDFTDKWVDSDFANRQFVLHYGDLTAHPKEALFHLVRWFAPDHTPDRDRITEVVAAVDGQTIEKTRTRTRKGTGVHAARDVQAFRYFAAPLFDALENLKLRREEVTRAFEAHLGRKPAELSMLRLQCFESVAALEAHLRASPEYKKRHGADT